MRFPWIKRDCAGAGRCRLRSHHVERLFPAQGTPAAIVKKLNAAVVDAMESPAVKERMQELGVDLVAPEPRNICKRSWRTRSPNGPGRSRLPASASTDW
jgi:hypothetical protein